MTIHRFTGALNHNHLCEAVRSCASLSFAGFAGCQEKGSGGDKGLLSAAKPLNG